MAECAVDHGQVGAQRFFHGHLALLQLGRKGVKLTGECVNSFGGCALCVLLNHQMLALPSNQGFEEA